MNIVERSKKAQDAIDQMVGENAILKTICANLEAEIERLRERVAVLEATLEGALDSCKIWERILTKALGEKE